MQLVRCEQCGAKALIAASQCPRCAHAFFLRGSRGETVPLGHCNVCDTYYPRRLGGCRWCGTKVSTFPTGLLKVAVGVVVAASVIGVGIWQYRSRTRPDEREAEQEARATMSVTPALAAQATPRVDSTLSGVAPFDSLSSGQLLAGESTGSGAAAGDVPAVLTPGVSPAPTPTPAQFDADSVAQRAAAAAARAAARERAPYTGPWTRAVAQSWVNVRASASLSATVVGVVTPNARVELGDSRGAWRRVRSVGFEGWADGAFFDTEASGR